MNSRSVFQLSSIRFSRLSASAESSESTGSPAAWIWSSIRLSVMRSRATAMLRAPSRQGIGIDADVLRRLVELRLPLVEIRLERGFQRGLGCSRREQADVRFFDDVAILQREQ